MHTVNVLDTVMHLDRDFLPREKTQVPFFQERLLFNICHEPDGVHGNTFRNKDELRAVALYALLLRQPDPAQLNQHRSQLIGVGALYIGAVFAEHLAPDFQITHLGAFHRRLLVCGGKVAIGQKGAAFIGVHEIVDCPIVITASSLMPSLFK